MVSRIYFLAAFFCSCSALLYQTETTVPGLLLAGWVQTAHAATAAPEAGGALPGSAEKPSCECPPEPDLETAFDQANLVFVGRVEQKQTNPLKKGVVQVKFLVSRKLKGFEEVQSPSVLVYTPDRAETAKPGECGFDFAMNGEYLVYAEGTLANFRTTACTRTNLLDKAAMDVQRIIRLYPQE